MAADGHFEENLRQWVRTFMGTAAPGMMQRQFGLAPSDVQQTVITFAQDMFKLEDRTPRRWTRKSVVSMLQRPDGHWQGIPVERWLALSDVIYGFALFLEEQRHITNAETIFNALEDYTDATYDLDDNVALAHLAHDDSQGGFSPATAVMRFADFTGKHDEAKADMVGFLRAHLSDMVITAEGADAMDLLLLSALAAGLPSPDQQFVHDWLDRYVMPDVDVAAVGKQYGLNLTDPRVRERLLDDIRTSIVQDADAVSPDFRMQIAARMDNAPLTNSEASQRTFVNRHADAVALMQLILEMGDDYDPQTNLKKPAVKPQKQRKPAKIIDFNAARQQLMEEHKHD